MAARIRYGSSRVREHNHSFNFIQLSSTNNAKCLYFAKEDGSDIYHRYYNNFSCSCPIFTLQVLPLKTLQILAIILLPEYLQIAEFRKFAIQERALELYGSQMQNNKIQKKFCRVGHPYNQ